jgi:hypothetical protein
VLGASAAPHDDSSQLYPTRAIRELRDLTRRPKRLLSNATAEKNRIGLEDANVKLGNVLSDVFGVSGQLMLALLERKAEPVEIAQLTKRRAQQRIPEIIQALEGHPLSEHHRQMIRYSVQHLEFVEAQMGDWTWPSPARSRRRAGTVMGTAADVAWGPRR